MDSPNIHLEYNTPPVNLWYLFFVLTMFLLLDFETNICNFLGQHIVIFIIIQKDVKVNVVSKFSKRYCIIFSCCDYRKSLLYTFLCMFYRKHLENYWKNPNGWVKLCRLVRKSWKNPTLFDLPKLCFSTWLLPRVLWLGLDSKNVIDMVGKELRD